MSTGQKFSNTQRHDPYRDFNFRVNFVGKHAIYRTGFMFVSGLKAVIDYIEQDEGGNIGAPYQIPDKPRFEPITLQKGMSEDLDLVKSFSAQFDSNLGVHNREKYTVHIVLLDRNREPVKRFTLYDAWISSYQTSDLNALGGAVFLESIVLSFTGAEVTNI